MSHRLALVLLPLTVGVAGTAGYLASMQGAGAPIVALAAMPSAITQGAVTMGAGGAPPARERQEPGPPARASAPRPARDLQERVPRAPVRQPQAPGPVQEPRVREPVQEPQVRSGGRRSRRCRSGGRRGSRRRRRGRGRCDGRCDRDDGRRGDLLRA